MIRFHLVRVSPVFELYASPINFDPDAPLFPVSSPSGYARELSNQIGLFHTAGMPEDHGKDRDEFLGDSDPLLRLGPVEPEPREPDRTRRETGGVRREHEVLSREAAVFGRLRL